MTARHRRPRTRGLTAAGRARHAAQRLPASERRDAIVEAALEVFARSSYARATTAEIARAAGVSEPILYRHFASKRALWMACLDTAWAEVRALIEQKVVLQADESPAGELRSPWESPRMPNLWLQGVTESSGDPELRDAVAAHMRDVHRSLADLLREQQAAGRLSADRDADAEAWIFVAGGLLRAVGDRLGGVLTTDELAAIGRERRRWLSGGA